MTPGVIFMLATFAVGASYAIRRFLFAHRAPKES
jgi:hypothetical protein